MSDLVYTPLKVRPAAGQSGRELYAPTIKRLSDGSNAYIAFSTIDLYNRFIAMVLDCHDPKLEAFFREPEDLIWHPLPVLLLADALDIAELWVDITYEDTVRLRRHEYIDRSYREWSLQRGEGEFRVLHFQDPGPAACSPERSPHRQLEVPGSLGHSSEALEEEEEERVAEKEEGMNKYAVECSCGDGKPPTDLSKVASTEKVTCDHCGRVWHGEG